MRAEQPTDLPWYLPEQPSRKKPGKSPLSVPVLPDALLLLR